ncbi:DUF397 domain-containing protein [Streptomyces sp. 205]|uniref:DUF397 domain-containing protein n=2 Tax=Streptomyces coffeae TaxID=621382 RepID=A0ABS1NHE1_9ACTN|nr:DUF397 domain-containing protein [Streptomyces coffeae]
MHACDDLTWVKSSYSGSNGGQCVEVAARPNAIHVRDSKDISGPNLTVSPQGWAAFIAFAIQSPGVD